MFYKTAKWHVQEKSLRDIKQHKTNRCAYSVADHVMYIYVDDIFFFNFCCSAARGPSHNETRGSFATISDGRCGLIDWLAFYLMRRLELADRWKWVGYCFLLLFSAAARLVSHGKWLFR